MKSSDRLQDQRSETGDLCPRKQVFKHVNSACRSGTHETCQPRHETRINRSTIPQRQYKHVTRNVVQPPFDHLGLPLDAVKVCLNEESVGFPVSLERVGEALRTPFKVLLFPKLSDRFRRGEAWDLMSSFTLCEQP